MAIKMEVVGSVGLFTKCLHFTYCKLFVQHTVSAY